MKNILLLTDFSDKSDNAHQYALELHKGKECTFYLLSIQKIWEYTTDDLMMANPKDDINTALLGDNRTQLTATKRILKKQYATEDFTFQSIVDYDVFTDAISQAVDEYDINLIVCGTDGKSGIIEVLFSSHTLRIIRKVDCPILVIPDGFIYQAPVNIQYLLDYDDVFEMCGKEPLIDIVRNYKSTIDVLRLTFGYDMEPNECKDEHLEIQKFFPSNHVSYHSFVDQDPIQVLKVRLEKEPAQLQVLSAHKETFLERLFSNSHLSKIVNTATLPLLILRDCNR